MQDLLQDGESDALFRYRRATQNLLFADGRQHIDWSLKEKAWRDSPRVDGKAPPVTMNYIRPILRSRGQRLMSSELTWRAIPKSNAHEDRDRATTAATLLKSRWSATEMDAKARAAIFFADCCGVAYFKQFWNPNGGPMVVATVIAPHPLTTQLTEYPVDKDGNVLADDQGNPLEGTEMGFKYRPGDTDTALRTIFNIRTNFDAQGLEPNEGFRWLIDSEVIPIHVVKERWGERANKVQTVQGVGIMRQYERIIRSVAGRPGTSSNDLLTGRDGQRIADKEITLLSEYWEAPTESLPKGRLIVMAGDELLYPLSPEEEGLPQDIVPFVAIYSERRPFDPTGRPVVDDLIAPQKVINQQWEMLLTDQNLGGLGQWAMFDIPGLSNQITNLNGAHIKIPMQSAFGNRSIGDLVQRINSAPASPDSWRFIQEAKAAMFDIAAFHEIQRGQVPPGVDSGIAVQLLQEAENGQMHDSVRGLKASFLQWGRQTGKLATWGYGENETRWIPQHRPDLGYLVESVKGTDLPDFDTIDLDLEGFRPQSQAAMNAEIKEAITNGWMDARQGLQMMDLGRGIEGAFESQTRHYSRARRENLAIEKGEFQVIQPPAGTPQAALGAFVAFIHPDGGSFLLPQDDDHMIHLDVHQEIALDDTKPLATRRAALFHIAEHRAIIQQQIQSQMMMEAAQKAPKQVTAGKPPTKTGANNA